MLITSKLEMDLRQPGFKQIVYAVQNDSNTRALEISLFIDSTPWEIPPGTTAAVSFRKMDLTSGLYDTLPDGSTKAVTFSGNTLTSILAPQVLTCAGKVDISIALYDPSLNRLGVFPVLLYVSADPSAGKSPSNNYYYLSTLAAVNGAIGDLSDLRTLSRDNLVEAINEIVSLNGGTITNEQVQAAVNKYLEANPVEPTPIDATLTKGGYAADSKAVGDALAKKAAKIHQHTKEDITDFPTSLPASDVPDWAKQPQKPSYTASEVKARPDDWMPTPEQIGAAIGRKHLEAGTDLNTITKSGMYRLEQDNVNTPSEVDYGQLLVIHGDGDTITQIAAGYSSSRLWTRSGNPSDVGGSGSWTEWAVVYDTLNKPSLAELGAAPAGYGLGEYPSTVITNPDTITKSGFYKAVCNFSEYYQNITAWVEMIASSESYATQHAYFDMHEGIRLTRYKIAGVWQPWEWDNPPMGLGIEFRTTERFNGKPVYTVSFNMGMASDNKMTSYPIEGDRFLIRGLASCDGHPLPYNGTSRQDDTYIAVDFAKYEAYIRTNSYNAGKTVYAQVWYVKGPVE